MMTVGSQEHQHLENLPFPLRTLTFPMNSLFTTGFLMVRARSAKGGAHSADPNRVVKQRKMPRTRSNLSETLISQGVWRILQTVVVDNGWSGPLGNRTRSKTSLPLRLAPGFCMLGLSGASLPRPH